MNTHNNHTDDFKTLFDNVQMANVPLGLEDKIMTGIELQKMRQAGTTPHWLTSNFILFSASIFLLAITSVLQYFTVWNTSIMADIRQMTVLSTGVFLILWIIETADEFLQLKLSSKFQSNFH